MEFDCTKPLGNDLEKYMKSDLVSICTELSIHGIVYESQFVKLHSLICKHNTSELVSMFQKRTKLDISYGYDQITCNFFFFNTDMYSREEAMQLSIAYQQK